MKYTVHNLELNRAITLADGKPAADGTIAILAFQSLVAEKNLEPAPADHLAGRADAMEIPAGFYLFTQGVSSGIGGQDEKALNAEADWRDAAEAVWLESLWRDVAFKNAGILVRILAEDSNTVYQIFREIERKKEQPL